MTVIGAALEPGTLVGGKYRIDRVLGEGGMGIVYAATHTQLEQRVALKFLLASAAQIPDVVERFAREARAAVRIHSEHVARVLDVGEHAPGVPYIVIEYLEGQSLDALLQKEGRLATMRSADYILQASEALAEAHALGIIHRDIKPGNLFLAQRPGRSLVKVLDFGISKMPLSTENRGITGAASLLGSPGYMSPEQIGGARDADVRSDIWALGVVLYEMLAGAQPFPAETLAGLVTAVLYRPHVSLRQVAPHVPPELEAVVDRCLAKDPEQRFPNIGALARALAPFGSPGSAEAVARISEVLGIDAPNTEPTARAQPEGAPRAINLAPTIAPRDAPPTSLGAPAKLVKDTTLAPNTLLPRPRTGLRTTVIVAALLGIVAAGGVLGFFAMRMRHHAPVAAASIIGTPMAPPAVSSVVASAAALPSASAVAIVDPPPMAPSATATSTARGPHVAKARPSAAPSAAPAASAPPECHLVSTIDEEGNKRFTRVCP